MQFAHPAWLLAIFLLPAIALTAGIVARSRRLSWASLVANRLRPALIRCSSPIPRWIFLGLLLTACLLLTLALARPQGDAGTRSEKSIGRNLLIALDISRSMRVPDIQPDRLSLAKTTIFDLMDAMPAERIGLIGFAGTAYLYAPLTVDHNAVRETVEQIDETWTTIGGTNFSDTLQLAVTTLKATGQKNNTLVILSDGEEHDDNLDDAIREAKLAGVRIITIGVGTENGDYVPNREQPGKPMTDRYGKPVLSRLEAETLRRIAHETGGSYIAADAGAQITELVKATVAKLDAFEMEGRERKIAIEFYQWLVLPAILLLIGGLVVGTRWRGVGPALVALMVLNPEPASAFSVYDANHALAHREFGDAAKLYQKLANEAWSAERKARFHLAEATAAYRNQDFDAARAAFSKSLLSTDPKIQLSAHHGMANTLFQSGWRLLADAPYAPPANHGSDLTEFDAMVRQKLKSLTEAENSNSYRSIQNTITNWTDAIHHDDSALAIDATNQALAHNRQLTRLYLNRLAELLKEHEEQTRKSTPPPQQDPPQAKDPNQEKPQSNPNQGKDPRDAPGGQDPNTPKPQDRPSGKDPKEDPKHTPDAKKPEKSPDSNPAERPGESPEEKARRILKENGDIEKGPLTPGFREFRPPEKDW